MELESLYSQAIALLQKLISTPSFSKEEAQTASELCLFFGTKSIEHARVDNNVFVKNKFFNPAKPTILLNSHHDTVKPSSSYTLDPFNPIIKDEKLYGLGSNDAGGALVSLIATFLHYYDMEGLKYNLVLAASAEEEISGTGGIEALLPYLPSIDFAIVGEPTLMQMAVAERGLLVLDCIAQGQAGHAARNEGINSLYKAIKDIEWIRNYQFPKVSDLLGPVSLTVTSIETENKAHNVVPAKCSFIVDARINELYSFEEIIDTVKANIASQAVPRSLRLKSSSISLDHSLVKSGIDLGLSYYGSPTTSDKALMPFPALKIGPGDSARSHTADEFIFLAEIKNGISTYIKLLSNIL